MMLSIVFNVSGPGSWLARLLPRLMLPVLLLCAIAARGAPLNVEACAAIRECIDSRALCALVQLPGSQRASVTGSEAFADMESRVESLQARRTDVRYAVVTQDR